MQREIAGTLNAYTANVYNATTKPVTNYEALKVTKFPNLKEKRTNKEIINKLLNKNKRIFGLV